MTCKQQRRLRPHSSPSRQLNSDNVTPSPLSPHRNPKPHPLPPAATVSPPLLRNLPSSTRPRKRKPTYPLPRHRALMPLQKHLDNPTLPPNTTNFKQLLIDISLNQLLLHITTIATLRHLVPHPLPLLALLPHPPNLPVCPGNQHPPPPRHNAANTTPLHLGTHRAPSNRAAQPHRTQEPVLENRKRWPWPRRPALV